MLALFFLIIGTEVKREFTKGALSTVRTVAFPLAGAIGGIVAPIAVYLAFAYGTEAAHGWGTVITSDTAFALAIMAYAAMSGALKVRLVPRIPYVLLGLVVWGGTYVSGIHATIAGVMLGLLSPTRSRLAEHRFADRVHLPS